MRRREAEEWVSKVTTMVVPADGLSISEFANALPCHPADALSAARFLHRRRLVWLSMHRGHGRVFPSSMRRGRGRPKAVDAGHLGLIPESLARFLTRAHPILLQAKLWLARDPGGAWNEHHAAKAQVASAVATEAENLMGLFRQFMASDPGLSATDLRAALWLDQREVMPAIARTQPELLEGSTAEIGGAPKKARKRLPKNMPDEERMIAYIEAAGRSGVAAYEIARRAAIPRDRVERIGEIYENMGVIRSAVVRTSGRGRTGTRYFAAEYGEPVVADSGRLILT